VAPSYQARKPSRPSTRSKRRVVFPLPNFPRLVRTAKSRSPTTPRASSVDGELGEALPEH